MAELVESRYHEAAQVKEMKRIRDIEDKMLERSFKLYVIERVCAGEGAGEGDEGEEDKRH